MYVATGGRTYVTANRMYVATGNFQVLISQSLARNQLIFMQKSSLIRSPSYARRSGHRHCPPAYR